MSNRRRTGARLSGRLGDGWVAYVCGVESCVVVLFKAGLRTDEAEGGVCYSVFGEGGPPQREEPDTQ